jgi:FlaA1/EpsC-like NDP-sugar epimerase
MGATKRVAELMTLSFAAKSLKTRYMMVRFGNVLGSNGSVVPLFMEQVKRGGPVTITHPEVTRFFMTISEASQLILQSGSMGQGGEIFILDMGTPVKIVDLAKDVIRLSGMEPDRDIEIKFVGLRPGEKLYEELITNGEGISKTYFEKILVLNSNVSNGDFKNNLTELINAAFELDKEKSKNKLLKLVPEFIKEK